MDNLKLYLATYNVGTNNPDQGLLEFLSISSQKNEKLPDFFVIGLQEVKLQPLMDALFDDSWTTALRDILDQKGYIKLKSVRLQGLLLSVFSLRKHVLNVREIESEYTRTGFGGMWGNKGAVSIRLSIYGCSICFVNAHLTAHDYQLKERIEDYNNIIKDQDFHVEETSKIFYHDYVFWMGDLNFRLFVSYDATPEEIGQSILKKDLKNLLEVDQLKLIMKDGRAFSEFTEKDPDFPPTFKFDVGTNAYDYKRRPAWTDRILYCVNSNNYENVTLKAEQLSYKSHPSYVISDHKPVSADFNIKIPRPVNIKPRAFAGLSNETVSDQVFSDYSEHVVQFDKVPSWEEGEDNKAYYKVTKDIPATTDDWIGLFKENFGSLDDYVTYEYVSKCANPTEELEPPTMERPQKFQVTIPDVPSRCRGNYCLVYFSQTEDKISFDLAEGVKDASCTCPRGTVNCSHMAAVLYYAHYSISATDIECQWSAPRSKKEAPVMKLKDIYPKQQLFRASTRQANEEEICKFQENLGATNVVGFAWLLRPEPEKEAVIIPDIEEILQSEEYITSTSKNEYFIEKCALTISDIHNIEKITRGQHSNASWYIARKHRLTASRFGLVLSACNKKSFPPSLFKSLTEGYNLNKIAAVQWGKEHEKTAISEFNSSLNVTIETTGLWLDPCGFLGASPDGLIGDAVVEVKCPYKFRDVDSLQDATSDQKYFYYYENGSIIIKKTHNYYHQAQAQMYFTNRNLCYFVIWTPKCLDIITVNKDPEWITNLDILKDFYLKNYIPHLYK